LRPAEPRCLPLEQAAEAHRLLESGRTTGTLVLVP
jgi:NADPH:quinone reductase-like Zn-dependent oxidoreductase